MNRFACVAVSALILQCAYVVNADDIDEKAVATTNAQLDQGLSINLPKGFQLQKTRDKPLAFVAIGKSPNATGNKRPAILLFVSQSIAKNNHAEFLKGAETVAKKTMQRFGIKPTKTVTPAIKNGIQGVNINAKNDAGDSWWMVRVIHLKEHSIQVIIGSFEKNTFTTLSNWIATNPIIEK